MNNKAQCTNPAEDNLLSLLGEFDEVDQIDQQLTLETISTPPITKLTAAHHVQTRVSSNEEFLDSLLDFQQNPHTQAEANSKKQTLGMFPARQRPQVTQTKSSGIKDLRTNLTKSTNSKHAAQTFSRRHNSGTVPKLMDIQLPQDLVMVSHANSVQPVKLMDLHFPYLACEHTKSSRSTAHHGVTPLDSQQQRIVGDFLRLYRPEL